MSERHSGRLSTLAALLMTVGWMVSQTAGADSAAAPVPCKSVADLLGGSDALPPLPPRDPSARPIKPAERALTPNASVVVDVVVSETVTPAPAVHSHGWRPAGRDESAGRVRLDVLRPAQGEVMRSTDAVSTLVTEEAAESAEPLVDVGFLQCEAVFDGVPALMGDLAPVPISESDDALTGEMRSLYALAPQPLNPSEVGISPSGAPELVVVPESADVAPPAIELTPDQVERLTLAAAELHKPIGSVSLATGLEKRQPPDLSSTASPQSAPISIWGQPWPDTRLASYRYTVPFNHRPLYFEQPNLERCGRGCGCLTTYASAAHFFGSVVLLPLHAVLDPPCRCVPTLGDCPTCHPGYGLCPTCNRGL